MITIYCQYSYGGFKIYKINGIKDEILTQEVTAQNNYGFPVSADTYFSHGGAKIIYRVLPENKLMFAVREIQGPIRDEFGRGIPCAVQFIGDMSDRDTLDDLVINVCNQIKDFEQQFAGLFDFRKGLGFDGAALQRLIDSCQSGVNFHGKSPLLAVRNRKTSVMLFVPASSSFKSDRFVQNNVMKELALPHEAVGAACMTMDELLAVQRQLVIDDASRELERAEDNDEESLRKQVESFNKQLISQAAQINVLSNSNKQLHSLLKCAGIISGAVILILIIALLSKCSVN